MKFKRRLSSETGLTQIDFVPFINLAFLCLIFVILISKAVVIPGISLKQQDLLTPEMINRHALMLTLDANNGLSSEGAPMPFDVLEKKLLTGEYLSVFIQADSRADLASVGEVYQICKEAGIERIGLATTTAP